MADALRDENGPRFVELEDLFVLGLFGGIVLIEAVFTLPGLGGLAVTATTGHDIPTVLGVAMTFTVIVVLVNLAIEVIYAMLNPKVCT